jgi:AcrR family transcriptional regulator
MQNLETEVAGSIDTMTVDAVFGGSTDRIARRWSGTDRARSNVRALMDAALDLCEAEGCDAVSVDDICANAGLAKGTFYSYFRKKEVLINALTFSRLVPERKKMKEFLDRDCPTVSTCEEFVRAMVAGVCTLPRPLVQRGLSSCLSRNENVAKFYSTDHHYHVCIRQIIARGMTRSEIEKCWSVSVLAGSLGLSLLQGIQLWAMGLIPDDALEADLCERTEVFLHGAATARKAR